VTPVVASVLPKPLRPEAIFAVPICKAAPHSAVVTSTGAAANRAYTQGVSRNYPRIEDDDIEKVPLASAHTCILTPFVETRCRVPGSDSWMLRL